MKGHRNYGKIHRLGKDEVDGILEGICYIQEKVDGANTSIWIEEGIGLMLGTRTRILTTHEEFNGFVPYVMMHEGIKALLEVHPTYRLYGEWLVKHTISYKETAYKKFYLFDIYDNATGEYLPTLQVESLAEVHQIEMVPRCAVFTSPTPEAIKELVGKSKFGDRGEGVVIKNYDFRNKFGDLVFAKLVSNEFMEDNAVVFGGNNKFAKTYHELWAVNKYMTLARVQKVMNKIQPEVNEKLDMKHIPRVCNAAYHDLITEEMWEIQSKVPALDFKDLRRLAFKKAKQIFVDIINDDVSIHDQIHVDTQLHQEELGDSAKE